MARARLAGSPTRGVEGVPGGGLLVERWKQGGGTGWQASDEAPGALIVTPNSNRTVGQPSSQSRLENAPDAQRPKP